MQHNRKLVVIIISLLFLSLNISPTKVMTAIIEASDGYPVHNLSTTLDYRTIQEAIDAPQTSDGNIIKVDAGTYYEHVTVRKSVVLSGESNNLAVIDGNGTGTVIQITASDVSIGNFTIENAGEYWTGLGYPDSCVAGNSVKNITIEDNLFSEAAVSVWFGNSSFVTIDRNVVFNATSMGIVGYGAYNLTARNNFIYDCDLVGIHIDGNSTNCILTNNTVTDCLEGIEIEKSAENFVNGNQLTENNATVVLNSNVGQNVLKGNNMTSDWYNLIVWGSANEAFIQDIDTSNTLNNKTAYYITNSDGSVITPSGYPNMGYLAIVNCTNVAVNGIDLSLNRDGLLIANSSNCILENMILDGNVGPLLSGGLTFFRSNSNTIINSRISNNSVGLCLCQSNNNTFVHNSFVKNSVHLIANFVSPFSPPSGSHSINKWDDNYPSGGNYWSDYTGTDSNQGLGQNTSGSDGFGDSAYRVNTDPGTPPELVQFDHYPLMGMFNSYNVTYYTEFVPHSCSATVISNSTISGFDAPIWIEHPEVIFLMFNASGAEGSTGFCRVSFPTAMMNGTYHVSVNGTEIPYNLLPCSDANMSYLYFNYAHSTETITIVPELPSFLILPSFFIAALLAGITRRRKHR